MRMKKKLSVLAAALALTLALAACGGQQGGRLAYIGADAAKALALELADLTTNQADAVTADMDTRNGLDYYRVEVIAGGKYYRYDVDALTGTVIASQTPDSAAAPAVSAEPGTYDAPAVSVLPAGSEAPADSSAPVTSDAPAASPAPSASSKPVVSSAPVASAAPGSVTLIGEAKAKQIALDHAGLTESQVTFVRSYLDRDDGRQVYDVEFYVLDGQVVREYDYEIDAYSGAIRDVDYDAEYYSRPVNTPAPVSTPSGSSGNNGAVTADEAKAIALAQVPGATASHIRQFHVDYDDGRVEYEGTIIYNEMEYEFEIDGYSGAIRDWDVESIYDD